MNGKNKKWELTPDILVSGSIFMTPLIFWMSPASCAHLFQGWQAIWLVMALPLMALTAALGGTLEPNYSQPPWLIWAYSSPLGLFTLVVEVLADYCPRVVQDPKSAYIS